MIVDDDDLLDAVVEEFTERCRAGRAPAPSEYTSRYPQLAEAERMQPGLGELRYQDLRDTAVTRLAMAGCTLPQIAAITGHSAPHITGVIKHYLALTDTLADQGIGLLNDWSAKEGIAI